MHFKNVTALDGSYVMLYVKHEIWIFTVKNQKIKTNNELKMQVCTIKFHIIIQCIFGAGT